MFASILTQIAEPGWLGPGLDSLALLLAIPVASSLVTSALRYLVGAGVNPRYIVWGAAFAITGYAYATSGLALPAFTGDPAAFVSAWLVIATGFSEFAKKVYDLILRRLPILAGPD